MEYTTFKQLKGYDHYSFEYPVDFKLTANSALPYPEAANILIFENKLNDGSIIVLQVNISSPGSEYPNAKTAVDKFVPMVASEILERSTATKDGIACEVITYMILAADLRPYMVKMAVFDYNKRLWSFRVMAEESHSGQARDIFKHLFNTFKLLP